MSQRKAGKVSSTSKRYVAMARVSSREQEREGFSLDVQVDALTAYAKRSGGTIVKMFRVAETASKSDERKTFKELLAYARKHAADLDGLLVYKIDRAARNLPDYVELEKVESANGVPLIAVSQPTENTPAGRMQRRVLASMASFYTEQQSLDVTEGLSRRAQSGLFVGMAPYGYCNERINGRSLVKIDEPAAANVRLIFDLYAHQNCTIDAIVQRLTNEGISYQPERPAWVRSKVHAILHDRSYIGELSYRGQWLSGSHEPLVSRELWNRVQALWGGKVYKAHELLYASGLMTCGHCGNLITGERVTKPGGRSYVYYRCTLYNTKDHPRVRLPERDIDEQFLALFRRIRQPDTVREWFARQLRLFAQSQQQTARVETSNLQRDLSLLRDQQDRLLNLRLLNEIEADTFSHKRTELRDRIANVTLKLEAADRSRAEQADIAIRTFELSQLLEEKWLAADHAEKRHLLQFLLLNCKLDDVSLVPTMRKPFDVLVEGLVVPSSRGDKI